MSHIHTSGKSAFMTVYNVLLKYWHHVISIPDQKMCGIKLCVLVVKLEPSLFHSPAHIVNKQKNHFYKMNGDVGTVGW